DVLALSINKFFRRTDEAQDVLENLFHTVQVRDQVAIGVASSDSSAPTFHSDFQISYLPNNLLLDVPQFRAQAISMDRAAAGTVDSTEQFETGLMGGTMSSQERGTWEELANSHTMSAVKSFQIARNQSGT